MRSRSRNSKPPLVAIAHDGRGEGLRLRLYLSMIMLATRAPHQLRPHTAAAFARTLDLPDAGGQGARRINAAQRWLAEQSYILRQENGTHPPTITILNCDGSGGPWQVEGPRWVTLPIELWSNAWILAMSGTALHLYVILRELTGGRDDKPQSARLQRKREYGLSDDSWTRGSKELEELGLLHYEFVKEAPSDFDRAQGRNQYRLIAGALDRQAEKKAVSSR